MILRKSAGYSHSGVESNYSRLILVPDRLGTKANLPRNLVPLHESAEPDAAIRGAHKFQLDLGYD